MTRASGDAATSERAADHARILEEVEAHRAVVEHVMAMDERDRELLLARYFQDRSPAEIARREGRTTAAVSSQLTRAHARLRARLEASGGRERWLAGLGPLLAPTAGPAAATRIASSVLAWSWSLGAVAVSAILLGAFLALRGPGPEATAADVTVLGPTRSGSRGMILRRTSSSSTRGGERTGADRPPRLRHRSRHASWTPKERRSRKDTCGSRALLARR